MIIEEEKEAAISMYSLEICLSENENLAQNHSISVEENEVVSMWLSEQYSEDEKIVKVLIGSVFLIQLVIFTGDYIACNIPIATWLFGVSLLASVDIIIRCYRLYTEKKYLVGRQINMQETIKALKLNAIAEAVLELFEVAWVLYGQSLFYSEDNSCNWEAKGHSYQYLTMFFLLTFGMILLFKWIVRFIEVICQLVIWFKRFILRQPSRPRQTDYIFQSLQPDVFIISQQLQEHRLEQWVRRRGATSVLKKFFKLQKTESQIQRSNQCAICIDDLELPGSTERVLSLPCDQRHAFHERCLSMWLKRKNECPLCKSAIQPSRIVERGQHSPLLLDMPRLMLPDEI